MPIQRSQRPITPAEHARFSAPVTLPVTRGEAAFSALWRGGCLLVCAGIGVACLLSLGAFAGWPRVVLAGLAVVLTAIGLAFAWPLPGILVAALTGRERVVARTKLRPDALVESWRVPARRVFWTDFGDDTLTWLVETDDGVYVHVYGDEQSHEGERAWMPSDLAFDVVADELAFNQRCEGPLVPYVRLSAQAEDKLSQPFVTGYRVLEPVQAAALRPLLDADASHHAARHGAQPPAPGS